MESVVLDYLQRIRPQYASSTYAQRKYHLERYLKYLEQCNKTHSDVTDADITAYLLHLRNCNQQSKRRIWKTLFDFYAYLKLPVNPAALVAVNAPKYKRLCNIPSKTDISLLVKAMNKGRNTLLALRNLLLGELAYGSALRLCELYRLDIENIDVKSKTALVTGKGTKTRTVPLTSAAVRILEEYLKERRATHGPLFVTKSGRRLKVISIGLIFRTYTGRSPHLFRHACASHMLQNGCDIRYIQELLGHKYLTTTQVYTHFDKGALNGILNKLHPRANAECGLEKPQSSLKNAAVPWVPH